MTDSCCISLQNCKAIIFQLKKNSDTILPKKKKKNQKIKTIKLYQVSGYFLFQQFSKFCPLTSSIIIIWKPVRKENTWLDSRAPESETLRVGPAISVLTRFPGESNVQLLKSENHCLQAISPTFLKLSPQLGHTSKILTQAISLKSMNFFLN